MSKIRTGLVLGALATVLCAGAAFASGGTVKLKTDNTADGYYYNALGAAAGRYAAFYNAGEFDVNAIICGVRFADLDQSVVTPGVDGYTLGCDIRTENPNATTYADLTVPGLIAAGDANSTLSCTTTGAFQTRTFGGGAGIPDPLTQFVITMAQPANNNAGEGIDFCGILLDTNGVFQNSARSQSYMAGGANGSIGFNHFVEAVVFEPKEFDLAIRMTGSSRFAGDRGLPVQFARRRCTGVADCRTDGTDVSINNETDDFITGRFSIDNNTPAAPRPLNLIIEADRSAINPKLGPKDVTNFFKPIGGGGPIMNPVTFPNGRTLFNLEIKIAIKRKFLASFPVDLPFDVRLEDPNDSNDVPDTETQLLGLRANTGYYDNDSHTGGFFFSQSPVATGDALNVRFDAVDLPKPVVGNDPLNVTGAQVAAGEFGASGLAGLDAFELRREDTVLPGNPDLSPQGLLRNVGMVGDPGNADGIATGLPVTTVNIDFTNYVAAPINPALALNLFGMAYLSPGDTAAAVTAVGSAGGGDVYLPNSSILLAGVPPVSTFPNDNLEIRLDVESEFGTADTTQTKLIDTTLRQPGRQIAVEKGGRQLD